MKIVKLDENIKNLTRVVDNQKINAVTEMNPVMSDAYEDSLETDEAIEKELKESDKLVTEEPFLGAKNQPLPEDPVLPKVTLDESLFEDYDLSDRVYDFLDSFTFLDSMSHEGIVELVSDEFNISPDFAEQYVDFYEKMNDAQWHDTVDQEEESVDDFLFDELLNEDKRLSSTSIRYKGYRISLDHKNLCYNIYDKHGEMEDSGFTSIEDAKKSIDNNFEDSNDLIIADQEDTTDVNFEESLNEDANQRAAIYDDLVDYFDNWINDTIPTVPELVDAIPDYDGDWMIEIMTPEMNRAQDQYVKALANAAMTYYPDNVTEALDRSGEQRNDYFDFKQDVYDAISNVCKKYNDLSHEDIEDSVNWFLNMYDSDEDIDFEECMNEDARPEKKQGKGIHKVKEEEDEDLWSLVYTSLIEHPDDTNYAANHAYNINQLTDEERYEEVYTDYDGNIVVYGESEEKLLPAKRIADMYNLRATQSQSADSSRPEQKFKLTIIIPDEEIFDND